MRLITDLRAESTSTLRILLFGCFCVLSAAHSNALTFSDEQCVAELKPGLDSFELAWGEVPAAVSYRVYRTVGSETELLGETDELMYLVSDYASFDVTIQVKWIDDSEIETNYCSIAIPRYQLLYAEYYIGEDPGHGNGVEIPIEADQDGSLELNFDIGAEVDEGMAIVYLRYQDNRGLWISELAAQVRVTPRFIGENYSLVYFSEAASDWVPVESTLGQDDKLLLNFSSGTAGMRKPTFMLQSDEGHFSFPETLIYLSEKQASFEGEARLNFRAAGNGNESAGSFGPVRLADEVDVRISPNNPEGEDYSVLLELMTSNGTTAWPTNLPIEIVPNALPQANAGKDFIAYEYNGDNRERVRLYGGASRDPEDSIVKYLWEWEDQSAEGETVEIDLPTGVTNVRLTVFDGFLATATDDIRVEVVDLDSDDDGLQDSFEQYIADADLNDAIEGIEDVGPFDDFDGDSFSNRREQINLTDPTEFTVPDPNLPDPPFLRILRNPDGNIRFTAILREKGHYRLLTGPLGVDISEWELLAESDFEDEVFDYNSSEINEHSFFTLSVEGEAGEGFEGVVDDEEVPAEFFQITAKGLPLFLEANKEYSLELSQVEGSPGQSRINGEYVFNLVNLIGGEPVEFDYSINPPSIDFSEGSAVSNFRILTEESLYNIGIVLNEASVSTSSLSTLVDGVDYFDLTGGVITGELLEDELNKYRAASSKNWHYPYENAVLTAGAFGEYPGHSAIHHGYDLAIPVGKKVYPVNRGIVVRVGGQSIIVDHGNTYLSKYLHVDPQVKTGAIVEVGTPIAKIRSQTNPHLHLEIWKSENISPPVARSEYKPLSGEDPINFLAQGFSWKMSGATVSPWEKSIKSGDRIRGIHFSSFYPIWDEEVPTEEYPTLFQEVAVGEPVYVITSAVEDRSVYKLGMRQVSFFESDSDKHLRFFNASELEGIEAFETMGITATFARKEYYRYWFKWDETVLENRLGPRSFSIEVTDNFDNEDGWGFVLGPEFKGAPETYYIQEGIAPLLIHLTSCNGPYPESQNAGKYEDEYVFEISYESEVSSETMVSTDDRRVELRDATNGGEWMTPSAFELPLKPDKSDNPSESEFQIEVKITDLNNNPLPEDVLILSARCKKIPSIGHEVRIPIKSSSNDLELTDGMLNWQLVADSKVVNSSGEEVGEIRDPKGILTYEDLKNEASGLPLATSSNTRFGDTITDALYILWDSENDSFNLTVRADVFISSYLSEGAPTDNFVDAIGRLEFVNSSGEIRDAVITVHSYLDNIFNGFGNPWPIGSQTLFENNYNGRRPHSLVNIFLPNSSDHEIKFENEVPPDPKEYTIPNLKHGETFQIEFDHVGMNHATRTRTYLKIDVKLVPPATP